MCEDEIRKLFFEDIPSGEDSVDDVSDQEEDIAEVVHGTNTADLDLVWDDILEPENDVQTGYFDTGNCLCFL